MITGIGKKKEKKKKKPASNMSLFASRSELKKPTPPGPQGCAKNEGSTDSMHGFVLRGWLDAYFAYSARWEILISSLSLCGGVVCCSVREVQILKQFVCR